MNLQYISDKNGVTTSVVIPIKDWEELKSRYKELEKEENEMVEVPEWHKPIMDQRLVDKDSNPGSMLDFDQAMDDIEKGL
jgi:hypothetical protein